MSGLWRALFYFTYLASGNLCIKIFQNSHDHCCLRCNFLSYVSGYQMHKILFPVEMNAFDLENMGGAAILR